MAHLIRPWISYYTKNGKRVPKDTEGAKRVKQRARKWYAAGLPGWPKGRRKPLAADKRVARDMLSKLETREERMRQGLPVEPDSTDANNPVDGLLDEFEKYLKDEGRTGQHIDTTLTRCRKIIAGKAIHSLAELTPAAVLDYLASLRQERNTVDLDKETFTRDELAQLLGVNPRSIPRILKRDGLDGDGKGKKRVYRRAVAEALLERFSRGFGISTTNHYLVAIKSFTRWLVRKKKCLAADPLAGLTKMNAEPDIRIVRRALSAEEFMQFIEATRRGKTLRGLSGADRAVLYQFAARSGLRASEIGSLTPSSFNWDHPSVTVKAAYSKRRRRDEQPLPRETAELMETFVESKPKNKPIWPSGWVQDAAELVREDLAGSGIPYIDEEGRVYDFHALRHQYITALVEAGIHPKEAQELARHSTIDLTMNHYTHLRRVHLHNAVDKLPKLTESHTQQTNAS